MSHQGDLTKKKFAIRIFDLVPRDLILCFNISNWPKTRSLVALHQTSNIPNQIFYKPQKGKQTSLPRYVDPYTQGAVRAPQVCRLWLPCLIPLLWEHNTGSKVKTLASFTLRDIVSTDVMNMKICKECWLKRNILWQDLSWEKEEREKGFEGMLTQGNQRRLLLSRWHLSTD